VILEEKKAIGMTRATEEDGCALSRIRFLHWQKIRRIATFCQWLRVYLIFLCLSMSELSVIVEGSISPGTLLNNTSGDSRCIGLTADFNKLDNIQTQDLERIQNPSGNRNFEIRNVQRITRADGGVMTDRVRLVERIEGIKIRGADIVVNFKGCESGICAREVESLQGKTFREINVTQGYNVTETADADAVEKLMQVFGAEKAGIGQLSLEIFAATDGDHLAYFTDVLVERADYLRYFSVIIDAHTLDVLSICNLVEPVSSEIERSEGVLDGGPPSKGKRPTTRGPSRHLKRRNANRLPRYLQDEDDAAGPIFSASGVSCYSCSPDSSNVTWSSDHSMCQINSLYLNNTGRETICLIGTNTLGETVLGAGPVPDLHWDGTQDCKSTTTECRTTILPECSDAISDVQYGAIKTLTYFREYLGVMGGLVESADNPVPIMAKVHYSNQYCNAFYRFSANALFFGDCDCDYWTPLTSLDIIAHEVRTYLQVKIK
jgi:Thermolysin metallopeptidase, catalytic domain